MARVFIGVGHGGTDPGAVGYLVEKDVNLKMARACYDYLQARGIDTRISRTGDVTDKLVILQNFSGTFRSADAHLTFAETQVHYLIKLTAFFQNGIFSNDSDISCSVFYISRNIRTF